MKAFTKCFWPSSRHDAAAAEESRGASDGDAPHKGSSSRSQDGSRKSPFSQSSNLKLSMSVEEEQPSGSSIQTQWAPAFGGTQSQVTFCKAQQLMDVAELRWLGEGSQGVVYEGVWHGGSVVAVKFSLFKERDISAAWLYNELMFSRSLSHPHIVQTYDAKVSVLDAEICQPKDPRNSQELTEGPVRSDSYQSDEGFGDPFRKHNGPDDVRDMLQAMGARPGQFLTQLIMEHCDQGSLLNAIQQGIFQPTSKFGPKIAMRALYRTAREIAQGMVHLHQANVLHGDLKPANVLLMSSRKDKRGFVAKVSDFGLAHYLDPFSSPAVEDAPWGTLVFMAPERFQQRLLTHGSDVWSFGVMMWQMYTARIPYQGVTAAQLAQGITSGTLHLRWPAGSPEGLVSIVRECMAFAASQRPSFQSLVQNLSVLEQDVRTEGLRFSNSVDSNADHPAAAPQLATPSPYSHQPQRRVCRMSSHPDRMQVGAAFQAEASVDAHQPAAQAVSLQKARSQPYPPINMKAASKPRVAITDMLMQPDGCGSPTAMAIGPTPPESPNQMVVSASPSQSEQTSPAATKREHVALLAASLRASFTRHAALKEQYGHQSSSMDTSCMSTSSVRSKTGSPEYQSATDDASPLERQGVRRTAAAVGAITRPNKPWTASSADVEPARCIFRYETPSASIVHPRPGLHRDGSKRREIEGSRLRTSSSLEMMPTASQPHLT